MRMGMGMMLRALFLALPSFAHAGVLQWTTMGQLERGRSGLTLSAFGDGTSLLAAGGTVINPGGMGGYPVGDTNVYVSGAWLTAGSLKVARSGHTAATVGSRAYIFGGRTCDDSIGCFCAPEIEVFNATSRTWAIHGTMPQCRYGHASAVVGGEVYFVGGEAQAGSDAPVLPAAGLDVFDAATGAWRSLPAPYTAAHRQSASAAAIGSAMYLIGGVVNASAVSEPVVDALDATTGAWTESAIPLNNWTTGPWGDRLVAYGEELFLLGGFDDESVWPWFAYYKLQSWDGTHWATLGNIPYGDVCEANQQADWAREGCYNAFGAEVFDSGKLVLAGGFFNTSNVRDVYVLDLPHDNARQS